MLLFSPHTKSVSNSGYRSQNESQSFPCAVLLWSGGKLKITPWLGFAVRVRFGLQEPRLIEADSTTWAGLDQHMEPNFLTTETSRLQEKDKLFTLLLEMMQWYSEVNFNEF